MFTCLRVQKLQKQIFRKLKVILRGIFKSRGALHSRSAAWVWSGFHCAASLLVPLSTIPLGEGSSFRAPSENILRPLLPFSSRIGFVTDTHDVCCFQLWKIKVLELLTERSSDPPENLSELPTVRSKSSRPRDAGTLTGHSAGCYRNKDSVGTEIITLDFIPSFSWFDLFILTKKVN